MAKRSGSSSWQARNLRAQQAGYRNFYDYRAHDYGRSETKLSGEALRQARGHASAADLEATIRSGRAVNVIQLPVHDSRRPDGRYGEVRVVVDMVDGSQRKFRLRGGQLSGSKLQPIRSAISDAGTDVYTNPSLDVLAVLEPEPDDFDIGDDPETLADEMEQFDAELGAE